MIHVNSMMNSLFTTIASDSVIVSSGFVVEQEMPLNSDPNNTPWVGVYFGDAEINPYRIQINSPWMTTYNLLIYVQGASMNDAQSANDLLHRAMNRVLTAINSNRTLDGTVLHIKKFNIEPFQRDLQNEGWMFANQITLQAENYA